VSRAYRTPRILDQRIGLAGYQGPLRQLTITDLGHEEPTLLLSNQLRRGAADLIERDVVVVIDTDRHSDSDLRRLLRPRGFMLAIIEKDGTIAQRRPAPRDVREINAIIDRFPLRRQEMLERRPSGR
jgi:hypothetical protein